MRIFLGIVFGLFLLGFGFIETGIGIGVAGASHIAMVQFKGDKVEALIALVNCEECSLNDRNIAVWALGQLRDKRALPTLYKYRTGKSCNHLRSICQYEIAKAIKWTEGNSYMFPQVWRVMLWKDYVAPAKTAYEKLRIVNSGSKTITIQSGESSPRTITSGDFSKEMLTAHNNIRTKIKLPPLQWSSKLAAYSQKWANTLIAKDRADHNSKSPYGENILVTRLGSTPAMAVAEWASESQDYTYRNNACNGDCGHYTQLVWRSTREVGCAMAHNSQREIWVCSYDPPGNYRGEWPY
jgi:uncharacterized protein YkwD